MRAPVFDIGIKEAKQVVATIEACHGDSLAEFSTQLLASRLNRAMGIFGFRELAQLLAAIREDRDGFYDSLLTQLMPPTTEMFRDPTFWRTLREQVLPDLLRLPGGSLRIWQAAFDSGEELYSLLVLLEELGIRDRCILYSSYLSDQMLAQAQRGNLPARREKLDRENYNRFNLEGDWNRYVSSSGDVRRFRADLLEGIHFVRQSLAFSPCSPERMHLVLCRNQFLYFTPTLCAHNLSVFSESLEVGGVLALGIKEVLDSTQKGSTFTVLNAGESIYRRRKE